MCGGMDNEFAAFEKPIYRNEQAFALSKTQPVGRGFVAR